MKLINTPIEDLIILEPTIFGDNRGFFFESYNEHTFKNLGLDIHFIQDNISRSTKDVLRGLHFQKKPFAQGKLVQVLLGAVLDVAVDLRKNSKTYGHHYKAVLSAENKKMMYIPEGFAHGFLTLEDDNIFSYKCTHLYNKESEGGLMWNDQTLDIDWGIDQPTLSEKDLVYPSFETFNSPF